MPSDGSVTRLIVMLKRGDGAAAQHLWEAYFGRLVGLARVRLRGISGRMADEEDVALSAFDSFYRRAEQGQFPQVERKLRSIRNVWSGEVRS
jgi:ECF sigma factor